MYNYFTLTYFRDHDSELIGISLFLRDLIGQRRCLWSLNLSVEQI
uniref:Uncharacterized protein n=1 Tax=Rhizophora mucronata TaxID=61149 RepID=A0A2P2Q0Y2_RHIMU